MVGKDLDDDRTLGSELVLRGQLRRRLFKQIGGVGRQYIALLRGRLDDETAALRLAEVGHRVEQVECVLGPKVEWIAFECFLDLDTPGLHLAQTKQGHPEIQVRVPKSRRDFDGAARKGGALFRAARD